MRVKIAVRMAAWSVAGLTIAIAGGALLAGPARGEDRICTEDLSNRLDGLVQRPELARSRWGVAIATVAGGGEALLVDREADRFFIPASNVKLLTTAAALAQFGPNHRWTTQLHAPARPDAAGTVATAAIVPSGDPSLTFTELQTLAALAAQRTALRRVDVLKIYVGSRSRPTVRPSWEWDDLTYGYAPPIAPAIVDGNAIALTLTPVALGKPLVAAWAYPAGDGQWRIENETRAIAPGVAEPTGITIVRRWDGGGAPVLHLSGTVPLDADAIVEAIAVTDPAQHFADRARNALEGWGIEVGRVDVIWDDAPARDTAIALSEVSSPPLRDLVATTNLDSNNLYAEALYSAIAAQQPLDAVLEGWGVDPAGYRLRDGSGLSRQDLASPHTFVTLLATAATRSGIRDPWRASLPVAGRSGTLLNRFVETPLAGQLRAKTGTLTGVSALSGYLPHPELGELAFSILVNQSEQGASVLRAAMDEFLVDVWRSRSCGPPS